MIRKLFSLKAKIMFFVLLVVITISCFLNLSWLWLTYYNNISLAYRHNHKIVEHINDYTNNMFEDANGYQQIIHQLLYDDIIDENNFEELEIMLKQVVMHSNIIHNIYYATTERNMIMARRINPDTIALGTGNWLPKTQELKWKINYYKLTHEKNEYVAKELIKTEFKIENYDPFSRTWYQEAIKTKELIWLRVYPFYDDNIPGITTSIAFYNKNKDLKGVIGVDIKLNQISQYLQQFKTASESGLIFLMNDDYQIVANSQNYPVIQSEGAIIKIKTIAQINQPLFKLANQVIKSKRSFDEIKEFQQKLLTEPSTNKKYFVSLADTKVSLPWIIGIVMPEDVLIQEIKNSQNLLLIAIVIIVIAASILSLFLTDIFIATPISNITKIATRIENQNYDLTPLAKITTRNDELGRLARVLERMATEIYAREQQFKKQIAELQIEIDHEKKEQQVAQITESDYFKSLQSKAKELRSKRHRDGTIS